MDSVKTLTFPMCDQAPVPADGKCEVTGGIDPNPLGCPDRFGLR